MPDLTRRRERLSRPAADQRAGIVDWRAHGREAHASSSPTSASTSIPSARMGALPIGLQQLIELARVLFSGARIIILDEPTSALSPPEVAAPVRGAARLRASGRSIVFISHFLDDVLAISDTVTIFRNGRRIATEAAGTDRQGLADRAHDRPRPRGAGGELHRRDRARQPARRAGRARRRGLSAGRAFADVSLDVRAGEVLGIYGFMGCGQIELARALFGKLKADAGTIVDRRQVRAGRAAPPRPAAPASPSCRRAAARCCSTRAGLQEHLDQHPGPHRPPAGSGPVENATSPARHVEALRIRPPTVETLLGSLSGGNQQKVALAKWLTYPPKVLMLSEPTRGMDVGAKEDVVRSSRACATRASASSCCRPSPRPCCRSPTASW